MANTGIEKIDVFVAADAILATGKEPTIQAVREKLGTGSLTTISKHLKDWQAAKRNQSPIAAPPEALAATFQTIWSLAFKEAEKIFLNQKEALTLEKQKWEEEKKIFLEELEELEVQKHVKENKIKELNKILEREQELRDTMHVSLSNSTEAIAKRDGEIKALKERLAAEAERNNKLENQILEIARTK